MQRNEILNVNFKNVEPKRLRKIVLVTIGDPSVKNRRQIGGKIMVESIFPVIIRFLRFPPIRPLVEIGEISGSRVRVRSVDKRADNLIAATSWPQTSRSHFDPPFRPSTSAARL